MQKVLITVPDFEIGGFVSHTCNLAIALRAKGYHITALAFEPFGGCLGDMQQAVDEVQILWRGWETPDYFLRRVVAHLKKLGPDVLINNSVAFAQAALPYLDPALTRLSVVHSIVQREQRMALAHAEHLDWVVAVADNVATQLNQLEPGRNRITTIPVGVELPANPASVRPAEGAPLRLVYLGRLAPEKNLPALLQVLAQLHANQVPFQMTLIGSGPEESWLRAEVARLPFASQIHLAGPIPHRQVMAELAKHEMLLMTSRYEGTPHVVLEAMACGLVVACSNLRGSTDRIIQHGVNGLLCDPNQPAAFAQAIRELVANPAQFRQMAAAARDHIQAHYSVGTIGELYHQCIQNRRPRPLAATPSNVQLDDALAPYCRGFWPQAWLCARDWAKQHLRGRMPVRIDRAPGKGDKTSIA